MDREDAGSPAFRRRFDRSDQSHAVDLARRQQPGLPRDQLRRASRGVQRTGPRAHRRRLRSAAAGNHLRHAGRQGGDRGDSRALRIANPESRVAPAADDLGDDHRPQRPDALGADDRRVLGHDRARAAIQRRHQLRPRRARHAPLPCRARPDRRLLHQLLSQCRPAERLRPVRRTAGRHRRVLARVRRERLREHRRRLLRDDARAHPRDRARRGESSAPNRSSPASSRSPSVQTRTSR